MILINSARTYILQSLYTNFESSVPMCGLCLSGALIPVEITLFGFAAVQTCILLITLELFFFSSAFPFLSFLCSFTILFLVDYIGPDSLDLTCIIYHLRIDLGVVV